MRLVTKEKFYSRKSQIKSPRSKHFIIFEGTKSEQIYFDSFFMKNEIVNNIFYFLRDKDKEGWTNPKKIMQLLTSIINEEEKITYTYNTIFENIYDYLCEFTNLLIKNNVKNEYRELIVKNNINMDDPIDINVLYEVIKLIFVKYIDNYEINDILIEKDVLEKVITEQSTFDKELDKIYLIVDRDSKSLMGNQYFSVLKTTRENDVDFYVINPCFEFWLLLHYSNCLEYEENTLLENKCDNHKNTFVFNELKKHDLRYNKNKFDADKYIDLIATAIENSKKFENDINKLNNNVGTNLPDFINKIINSKVESTRFF